MTPSSLLIVVAIALVVMVVLVAVLKRVGDRSQPGASAEYELRGALCSPAERSFAGVLSGALPEGVACFVKVRLGDVFKTRKGLSPSRRATALNRINQKHVDFLLVRISDFAPVGGIELDDSSHDLDHRKARDAFVDEVFQSSQLPLLHVPAQSAYNQAELKAKIAALLERPPTKASNLE